MPTHKFHFAVEKLTKGFILIRNKQSKEAQKTPEDVREQIFEQIQTMMGDFFQNMKNVKTTLEITLTIEEGLDEHES